MSDPHNLMPLIEQLCRFRTGVVAPENDELFERIAQELPIRIHEYSSGDEYNGWVVPDCWEVKKAEVRRDGKTVFDGAENALGVAAYSRSFQGTMELETLRPRIVTDPEKPDAYVYHCRWQYRPWEADWALSIPFEKFREFEDGEYEIDLQTDRKPGRMQVAEAFLPGETDKTIVFNAHTCHPHMANDGFSGVATIIRLFQWLSLRKKRRYNYLAIFGPEHLGTVFFLRNRTKKEIESYVSGVFVEMTGTREPIKVTSTFLGGQKIDRAFRNVLTHASGQFVEVPWRMGAGNDETVWEAPGYEVPFVELTRCKDLFDPFPEYHTSLDTPASLLADQVTGVYESLQGVVEVLEQDRRFFRKFEGLLCLSNPAYDLYFDRTDPAIARFDDAHEKWGSLMDSLLRYFDGSMTVLDIAEKHDLPFEALSLYLRKYEEKDLVSCEGALIERPAVSTARPRA